VCVVFLGSEDKSLIADLKGRNPGVVLTESWAATAASPISLGHDQQRRRRLLVSASVRYSKKNKKQRQRRARRFSWRRALKTEFESEASWHCFEAADWALSVSVER
jgi:hypothetical protein